LLPWLNVRSLPATSNLLFYNIFFRSISISWTEGGGRGVWRTGLPTRKIIKTGFQTYRACCLIVLYGKKHSHNAVQKETSGFWPRYEPSTALIKTQNRARIPPPPQKRALSAPSVHLWFATPLIIPSNRLTPYIIATRPRLMINREKSAKNPSFGGKSANQ
jgi:hypothetical protein